MERICCENFGLDEIIFSFEVNLVEEEMKLCFIESNQRDRKSEIFLVMWAPLGRKLNFKQTSLKGWHFENMHEDESNNILKTNI